MASVALAAPASPTATDASDGKTLDFFDISIGTRRLISLVYAAQATALTESPTSNVKGAAFDRYVSIWFENTDFDMAAADRKYATQTVNFPRLTNLIANFKFFAEKGITLANNFALTHPSEPNYMGAVGGCVHSHVVQLHF